MRFTLFFMLVATAVLFESCKKDPVETHAQLHFKYKFDSTQARLDNIGQPEPVPAGHSAQSPVFQAMSSHYIELAPTMYTPLGTGAVVYLAPQTSLGGSDAIDFDQCTFGANNEIFYSINFSEIPAGTYEYVRVSLAYQNYDVKAKALGFDIQGRVSAFIGFNTYISDYQIKDSTITVNGNRAQGYWGFETIYNTATGQAPPGATTVPNPIFATSPIPSGSCVVTAKLATPLVITGDETTDRTMVISLSTNKSFEWIEVGGNNIYEPLDGDAVVDMGIRGMAPYME